MKRAARFPDILARLVEHLTQAKNLRDRVQQALIYPAFLAVAGVVLITIFITYMVPQLTVSCRQWRRAAAADAHSIGSESPDHAYWWLASFSSIGGVLASAHLSARMKGESYGIVFACAYRVTGASFAIVIMRSSRARSERLMENGIPLLRALDLVYAKSRATVILKRN